MNDEELTLIAIFRDLVSRPAREAARAVDELGDESQETAAQMAGMEAVTASSGRELDSYSRRVEGAKRATREHGEETEKTTRKVRRNRDELKKVGDETHRSTRSLSLFQRQLDKLRGVIGMFLGPARMMLMVIGGFAIAGVIAGAISLLAVSIQALAAAGVAAMASLGPLFGLLGAMFGIVPAMISGMGVMMLGMGGMAEAFSLLNNPEAAAGDIDKAMEKLSANGRDLLATVIKIGREWKGFKKDIQNTLLAGVGDGLEALSPVYKPIVQRNFTETASGVNTAILSFMKWMATPEGQNLVDKMLQLGTLVVSGMALSFAKISQIGIRLASTATPLIKAMIDSLLRGLDRLDGWIARNDGKLENYFTNSWGHFLGWMSVMGDFTMGFIAMLRAAAPMVTWMGDGLGEVAKNFRAWAENPETQERLKNWFTRMIPVMQSMLQFLGAIIMFLWRLGDGQETAFVKFNDLLMNKVLPPLEKLIDNFANTTILEDFMRALGALLTILSDPAFVESVAVLVGWLATFIENLAEWWSGLDPLTRDIIATLLVVTPLVIMLMAGLMAALANPVAVVIILGVVAAILLLWWILEKLWPWLKLVADEFGKFFENLKNGDWLEAWRNVQRIWELFKNFFTQWFPMVGPVFQDIDKLFGLVGSLFSLTMESLKSAFSAGSSELKSFFQGLVDIFSSLPNVFTAVFDALGKAMGPAAVVIQTLWAQAQEIMNLASNPAGVAAQVGGSILDKGRALLGGLLGFADGGTAPGGTLSLVGERGPEASLDRFGRLGMVGRNGPELINPDGPLQIVPHEFLRSLSPSDAGKAPAAAQSAVREAVMAGASRGEARQVTEEHSHLHLDGAVIRDEADIDTIIEKFDSYLKNKKERR